MRRKIGNGSIRPVKVRKSKRSLRKAAFQTAASDVSQIEQVTIRRREVDGSHEKKEGRRRCGAAERYGGTDDNRTERRGLSTQSPPVRSGADGKEQTHA